MVRQPIGGVAAWAHTGRGLRLSPALQTVSSVLANSLPSRCVLVAAAGAPASDESPRILFEQAYAMARRAADLRRRCTARPPPVALRDRPDRDALLIRYHARIAEAGLPLVLFYLYEAAGGISYIRDVLVELLARPESSASRSPHSTA